MNIVEAADAADSVFIDGRPTDDNLTVTVESPVTNVLRVAGLPYDVRIAGSTTADRLMFVATKVTIRSRRLTPALQLNHWSELLSQAVLATTRCLLMRF